MYVIIVYDVNVKRVSKVCRYLRTYLNWVQNSVFEGELTESEFKVIESKLKDIINVNNDSIMIYVMQHEKLITKKHIGIEKVERTNVL